MAVVVLGSCFPSWAVWEATNKRPARTVHAVVEYHREVYLGTTEFSYPLTVANCIYLGGYFSSDGFFEGVTLKDTPSGPGFWKQGQPVEAFPETLLIEVTAMLNLVECDYRDKAGKDGSPLPIYVPGLTVMSPGPAPIDLGESLRFKVDLVKGLSVQATEIASTRVSQAPFTESGPHRWNYEIHVRTKLQPLTDQVKLTVCTVDGRFLGRIIGGLDTQLSRRLYAAKKPKR